jgi:TonB family protein
VKKGLFFLLSLFIHLVVFSIILYVSQNNKMTEMKKEDIEITISEPSRREIVSQNYKNNLIPKDTNNLGKQNQVVRKEQVNRNHKNIPLSSLFPKSGMKSFAPSEDGQSGMRMQAERESEGLNNEDLPQGEETLLNAKEFKYHSYYERIRNQLGAYWYSDIRGRMQKLQSQGKSVRFDKITRTIVTLDKEGSLINVQIIGPSGLQDLDESSLQAFKLASPFPHPPKDLISSDGVVVIAWDFVLELN